MLYFIGVDIGGTKCAVSLGQAEEAGTVAVLHRCYPRPTAAYTVEEMLEVCISLAPEKPKAVGISCGSPLDSRRGRILSPPNLIGWDDVPITDVFR